MLAAAAYRWGLKETVGTAAACVTLLWGESIAVHLGSLASVEGFLFRHHFSNSNLGINLVELEPKHLLLRSVYLLVMGWLLGYLAEQHTQLRADVERDRFVRDLHDGYAAIDDRRSDAARCTEPPFHSAGDERSTRTSANPQPLA